jgi:glycerophosphoryl diester phosphodiesterase
VGTGRARGAPPGRRLSAVGTIGAVGSGFLDHPRPLAFAHRGGASHFPENSWKAFEHAVGLGYDYLETDAHATADGTVVAFHDKTLDRVTDGSGKIAELTAARVAAARIGGTEPIPLLADLLMAWPGVRFNIDIKDEPAIGPLMQVLARTNCWDRVCLTSFSGRRLDAARRLLPRPVCTATTPAGIGAIRAGLPARTLAARFAARGVRCAQIPVSMATRGFIARAHAAGLQVHAWTVNDPAVMASVLDLGADGIMTDQTAALRDLLIARGQWRAAKAG